MRIAFATFGCKVNQYETEQMRQDALRAGGEVVPFGAEADAYVINTCTVTTKSDYQCRQAIRSAARRGKGARIIVTGCYAATRPEELSAIPGVTQVLGSGDRGSFPGWLGTAGPAPHEARTGTVPTSGGRTRTFLKIQDGCDSRCAYCIVPHARGASRSLPPEEVLRQFDAAVAAGAPEIVLSGIHVGRYGADLAEPITLSSLLQELISRRGLSRVRISSIEPGEVTPEIVGLLGKGLCRHLHIPLQSGDDRILSAMDRQYTAEAYRELVETLAEAAPGIAIGADVMVGFPGEGEREFENTCRFIEGLPLTHLHVFSFSRRPGTKAASMPHQVPEVVKKKRNEVVRQIGSRKNLSFREGQKGHLIEAAVEKGAGMGRCSGITDNYIRVVIEQVENSNDQGLVMIRIIDTDQDSTIGCICETD